MKTMKLLILASVGAMALTVSPGIAGPVDKNPVDKNPIVPVPPEICGPWFAGFDAGPWWVQDYGINVPFVGVAGDHDVSFDPGFGVHVTPIGYRLCEMFAISLEAGFYQADVDNVTLPLGLGTFAASDGQLRLYPIMFNSDITIPITNKLIGYVGVGVGAVYRELEMTVPAAALLVGFHDSGWDCMIQARGGLAYEVARCMFVNVGYRWNHVFSSPDDIDGHMVEIGFTAMWH
jgi:opacity protein-like surface antigen